jgi:triosephosphate isomerase
LRKNGAFTGEISIEMLKDLGVYSAWPATASGGM